MTSFPTTYKAASFEKKGGALTIKNVELKKPEAGWVLVKPLAVGVCHTDALLQSGDFPVSYPIVPGHEIVGDVVAVGPGEKKWQVGQRVGGAWHGGHDFTCKQCQRAQFQMCQNAAINGVTQDGGFAEYVLLRTEAVVAVPSDVDPVEFAPILCAGVTVFNSIRRLNIHPGEIVAVQGLGGLGHLAVQFANKMGFRVVALSNGNSKKNFAADLGAKDYIDTSKDDAAAKLKELGGAALIVATAPNPRTIGPLIGGLEPGGTLLVLSPCGPFEVDSAAIIASRISVVGFASGHALDTEETIAFTQLHGIKCLVEPFPLVDAQKAFEHMMSGEARFRAVLTF